MPLYEYRCDACGHQFEQIQKFADPPLTACPKCGGAVQKLVSSPAFQFKGSGWYVTDYAKKGESRKDADTKDTKDAKETKDTKETKSGTVKENGSKDASSTPAPSAKP